jgi:diguanylate cyclase (GGDEF)-like protein
MQSMLVVEGKQVVATTDHDSIFETLPVAVLVFDQDRVCRVANGRAQALFARPDLAGANLNAIFAGWATVPDLRTPDEGAPADGSVIADEDGRLHLCQASHLAGAGSISLSLTDVSGPLQEAERGARDSLTGLVQRAALKDRLAEVIARAARGGAGAAIHFIDLDRFKAVNDTLGHPVGDALLIKVAERLRSILREGDVAARLGGDEFVVVQVGAETPEAAQALALRLIDLLGRSYAVQGHMLHIGASIGTAMFPADGKDAETLLRHADLALYRAKADGRGAARFFEQAMNARMQTRRALELDLRRALALRQFHLCFQPLVTLEAGKVTGFEALLRWDHPERGSVSPAEFIPLAEQIGLIGQIGDWVLRTACRTAATWPVPTSVAVNVSPLQFKGGQLAKAVTAALAQAGLPAARLELEITEGTLLDETNLAVQTLQSLRQLGVRVSMDDFGTGYSSLSYLRKFPFDKIKIDQSFIRRLGIDQDSDAIVRAVAHLGTTLGIRTTAEGVETAEQLARVRSEGCTEVQGYLTGRPLSAADAAALLERQARGDYHVA